MGAGVGEKNAQGYIELARSFTVKDGVGLELSRLEAMENLGWVAEQRKFLRVGASGAVMDSRYACVLRFATSNASSRCRAALC